MLPGRPQPEGSRAVDPRSNQFVGRYLTEPRLLQAQQLVALAGRLGTTALQLALAFCLRDARVSSVLVGARDSGQLDQSLAAAGATILIATHDLHALPDLADEAILLMRTVLMHDRPATVLQPQNLARAFGFDVAGES